MTYSKKKKKEEEKKKGRGQAGQVRGRGGGLFLALGWVGGLSRSTWRYHDGEKKNQNENE